MSWLLSVTLDAKTAVAIVGAAALLLGLLAAGWGAFRSQATTAWRQAAEGYKEQVNELTGRFTTAEALATSLQARVDQLEQLPDLRGVVNQIDGKASEVMDAIRDEAAAIKKVVSDEGTRTRAALDGSAQGASGDRARGPG